MTDGKEPAFNIPLPEAPPPKPQPPTPPTLTPTPAPSHSSPSTPEGCSSVRLDRNEGPLSASPIRMQGRDGSCYAATTALLIDAIMGPRGHVTDFTELAYGANSKLLKTGTVKGGSICPLIKYVNATGATCITFNRARMISKNYLRDVSDHIWQERINSAYDAIRRKSERMRKTILMSMGAKDSPHGEAPAPQLPIPLANTRFKGLAEIGWWTDVDDNTTYTPECPRNQRKAVPKLLCLSNVLSIRGDDAKKRRLLNAGLDDGLPVGLEICRNFMDSNISFTPYTGSSTRDIITYIASGKCRPHFVTVIGRRKLTREINGQKITSCQALVRNSYGGGCSAFRPKYRAQCETPKGDVWIDQNELMKYTIELNLVRRR